MRPCRTKRAVLFAYLCLAATTAPARADESPCQIHVILFVPADVDPPTNYQPRVDQIVDYAEAFFRREFGRWGHDMAVTPFRRSADGHVEVTIMQGKKRTADYKPVAVRMEVMDANRREDKLSGGRQVWWILMYRGRLPVESSYLGGFGQQIGGWAVCNLDLTPGRVDPRDELGSDFLEHLKLKGMLHELGHGLRLPHIGPLRRDQAGNTLMGPTHANFRRVVPLREDRVYLSEAEAALLSTNPAFRGVTDTPLPLPKLDVQNIKYSANPRNMTLVVSGRLVSDRRAVYAIVADESAARPGEYWTKTYVGKIEPDGSFEVVVTEPAESNGTLKTWFAFEDGTHTGDGKSHSRESGIAKAYTYHRRQWVFD